MNFVRGILLAGLVGVLSQTASATCCAGAGGGIRCDTSGFMVCNDGSIDKTCRCSGTARKPKAAKKRVLKMHPATSRGQVLKPGEKAPPTSLEESK